MFIPVIAVVQFVFTLAVSFLVAAGNVFFRDLGNVVGHLLRLWWFLSPGLYSLASLDDIKFFKEHHFLTTLANANPFAILFEAYRSVIYGTADAPPSGPPNMELLAILLVGERDLPGAVHDGLQAARAELRQGHLMQLLRRPPKLGPERDPGLRSAPLTSASATTSASPRRRPSAARSARCSGVARSRSSGRSVT